MTDNNCKKPENNNRRECVAMEKGLINEKFDNLFNVMKSIDDKLDKIDRKVEKMDEINHTQDLKIEKIRGDISTLKEKQHENKTEFEKQIDIIHLSIRNRDKKVMWITGIIVSIGAILTTVFINILK